jgi:uncharacterized protein (TIGR02265 family)
MFEGLFRLALDVRPDSAFADELRAVGFDLRDLKSRYDKDVWTASLDVAARHQYPELERYVAWRQLGRDFIAGYFETMIGRLIAVVLPLTSPERFLQNVPAFVRTGTSGVTTDVDLNADARTATLTFDGPHAGSSALMAGVVEVCFERMKVAGGTFTPRQLEGTASALEVRW